MNDTEKTADEVTAGHWEELKTQVGQWADANFDDAKESMPRALGVCEEYFELIGVQEPDKDAYFNGVLDAMADIGIYLLNFAYIEQIPLSSKLWNEEHGSDELEDAMQEFCRAVLKNHQGIRGYDSDNVEAATKRLLSGLCKLWDYMSAGESSYFSIVKSTFEKTVAKRNWKTNPTTG